MPICSGCEQKIPYQELDIHQRYCQRLRIDDDEASNVDVDTRVGVLEEQIEVVEYRFKDRLDDLETEQELPADPAGIEGSNIRFSRSTAEQEPSRLAAGEES